MLDNNEHLSDKPSILTSILILILIGVLLVVIVIRSMIPHVLLFMLELLALMPFVLYHITPMFLTVSIFNHERLLHILLHSLILTCSVILMSTSSPAFGNKRSVNDRDGST